jgi:hypothetical protein
MAWNAAACCRFSEAAQLPPQSRGHVLMVGEHWVVAAVLSTVPPLDGQQAGLPKAAAGCTQSKQRCPATLKPRFMLGMSFRTIFPDEPPSSRAAKGGLVASASRLDLHLMLERGFDERVEERMRLVWLGEELGVELAGEEIRVILQLDQLGKVAVG